MQSNESFRQIDPTSIRVGESTWQDVLREFGPPSGATTERLVGMESMFTFRYSSSDQKTFSMLLAYVLYLPFRWSDRQTGHQLVVEFDPEGVVSDLYAIETEAAWRPFEGPGARQATFFGGEAEP